MKYAISVKISKNTLASPIIELMFNARMNTYILSSFEEFVTGTKKFSLRWLGNTNLSLLITYIPIA